MIEHFLIYQLKITDLPVQPDSIPVAQTHTTPVAPSSPTAEEETSRCIRRSSRQRSQRLVYDANKGTYA